jgi:very-short-patch-repair endonuclease
MDFLLLFSEAIRVVIEVDGVQHYSDNGRPSPALYAEMVAADRQLRLAGYEVFRFGGAELQGDAGKAIVVEFFRALLKQHGVAAPE